MQLGELVLLESCAVLTLWALGRKESPWVLSLFPSSPVPFLSVRKMLCLTSKNLNFFFSFYFLVHPLHMEILGPGIEPEPLQWQPGILNPLCHQRTPGSSYSDGDLYATIRAPFWRVRHSFWLQETYTLRIETHSPTEFLGSPQTVADTD